MKLGFYEFQKHETNKYKNYVFIYVKDLFILKVSPFFKNELACSNYNKIFLNT